MALNESTHCRHQPTCDGEGPANAACAAHRPCNSGTGLWCTLHAALVLPSAQNRACCRARGGVSVSAAAMRVAVKKYYFICACADWPRANDFPQLGLQQTRSLLPGFLVLSHAVPAQHALSRPRSGPRSHCSRSTRLACPSRTSGAPSPRSAAALLPACLRGHLPRWPAALQAARKLLDPLQNR